MTWINDIIITYGLLGLFINVFLSYSILPSLTALPVVAAVNFFNPWIVFFVSLVAATFGSITNYYIGAKGIRRFLPENKKLKNAEKRIDKWGPLGLALLSWLPIVGDPLIIAAGLLKMDFWKFLLYSTIAKIWYLGLIIFFGNLINGWVV
ncbi:MAG: DedA family protein [Nanoarchaeota archaeon]|nr:DedA family protein [Nanoarchaeota archaeon]